MVACEPILAALPASEFDTLPSVWSTINLANVLLYMVTGKKIVDLKPSVHESEHVVSEIDLYEVKREAEKISKKYFKNDKQGQKRQNAFALFKHLSKNTLSGEERECLKAIFNPVSAASKRSFFAGDKTQALHDCSHGQPLKTKKAISQRAADRLIYLQSDQCRLKSKNSWTSTLCGMFGIFQESEVSILPLRGGLRRVR